MEAKKIYLSGKIAGKTDIQIMFSFDDILKNLKSKGYNVIVPASYTTNTGENVSSWETYARNEVVSMISCDEVYFIHDWNESKLCRLLSRLANDINIPTTYENI